MKQGAMLPFGSDPTRSSSPAMINFSFTLRAAGIHRQ